MGRFKQFLLENELWGGDEKKDFERKYGLIKGGVYSFVDEVKELDPPYNKKFIGVPLKYIDLGGWGEYKQVYFKFVNKDDADYWNDDSGSSYSMTADESESDFSLNELKPHKGEIKLKRNDHQDELNSKAKEVRRLQDQWVSLVHGHAKADAIKIIENYPELREGNLSEHRSHYGDTEYVKIYRGGYLDKESDKILSFTLDPKQTPIYGSRNSFMVKRSDIFWTLFSPEDEVWVDVKHLTK